MLYLKKKKILNFSLLFFNSLQSAAGITLLELILVMAIIAILSTTLWGNFFTSLTKGRDSRRKQDLESVAKALELYYYDKGIYPTSLPNWGNPFVNPDKTAVIYMEKLPVDPAYPDSAYCYPTTTDGSYYKLYARIENKNDPKIMVTPVTCGGYSDYNYGISSPNVMP